MNSEKASNNIARSKGLCPFSVGLEEYCRQELRVRPPKLVLGAAANHVSTTCGCTPTNAYRLL
jgi:hypothetical protein